MSQEQPRRPQQEPIKYGDVFNVQGELAGQPVAPKDAAMMQTAENAMLGQTQKGGAASIMQSAAMKNEKAGFVGHADITGAAGDCGVSITESELSGKRIITESVGGQVVGQYSQRTPLVPPPTMQPGGVGGDTGITIGEALEATALTAGRKPVEWSDAAAIQAAEVRATGRTNIVPGGVAAAAQSAATLNARATRDEDKTKLGDILADATSKLPSDRPATRRDAEGVTGAEMRNDPQLITHPTGVAASVAAAARLNQNTTTNNKTSN
ncbi:late embryogenesis abundant protein D-34-like [Quillaja saponaria]|uniref:Late embryogenesis abundant protein D-34-like n=1 Tax=Quillaja saponaria TaxID=32244 RepID=A0AAD7Q243_QUISA|nr:late embryogenesis abundant protein D-34-like [Quillaja saponaria]